MRTTDAGKEGPIGGTREGRKKGSGPVSMCAYLCRIWDSSAAEIDRKRPVAVALSVGRSHCSPIVRPSVNALLFHAGKKRRQTPSLSRSASLSLCHSLTGSAP